MTSGGAPTPPGQRVGALKFQPGNGFQRGQPIVFINGVWQLATAATGYGAIVGSVLDSSRFEAVLSGEIDQLQNLPTNTGTLYLTGTPGVLSGTGTIPALHMTGVQKAAIIGATAAAATTASPGSTRTFSVTGLANAAPLGNAAGQLDLSWFNLPLLVADVIAALPASTGIDDRYVRAPEAGGILDTDPIIGGSLVFDIDSMTQVIDSGFPA